MKRFLYFSVAAALTMISATAYAHHSFTATYDTDKTVTIEGKVTQFLLRNPHSFLHVTSTDKDGLTQKRRDTEIHGATRPMGFFRDLRLVRAAAQDALPSVRVTPVELRGQRPAVFSLRFLRVSAPLRRELKRDSFTSTSGTQVL